MSVSRRPKQLPDLAFVAGADAPVHSPRAAANLDSRSTPATILVVEDEKLVARLLVEALESSGFLVQLASNGEAALDLATTEVQRPDLLVTDYALPGISGVEVARQLSSRFPGLRVLLTSGYAFDALSDASRISPKIEFLAKPFTPRAFLKRVVSLLPA